jgi:hypothetical protein
VGCLSRNFLQRFFATPFAYTPKSVGATFSLSLANWACPRWLGLRYKEWEKAPTNGLRGGVLARDWDGYRLEELSSGTALWQGLKPSRIRYSCCDFHERRGVTAPNKCLRASDVFNNCMQTIGSFQSFPDGFSGYWPPRGCACFREYRILWHPGKIFSTHWFRRTFLYLEISSGNRRRASYLSVVLSGSIIGILRFTF